MSAISPASDYVAAAERPRAVASGRDPRLDFYRGIAMFIILVAHIPWNGWANWIPARFGFSDATEIFVFCSGMASAIAFGGAFVKSGWLMGTARVIFRCWQVYWAHICLFFFTAMMMARARQHRLVRAQLHREPEPAAFLRESGAADRWRLHADLRAELFRRASDVSGRAGDDAADDGARTYLCMAGSGGKHHHLAFRQCRRASFPGRAVVGPRMVLQPLRLAASLLHRLRLHARMAPQASCDKDADLAGGGFPDPLGAHRVVEGLYMGERCGPPGWARICAVSGRGSPT